MERNYFKKLQSLRKESGYSYQKMAEMLNVSKGYYWQIENKQRTLKYVMAVRIANIFKTKPDKIFLDEFSSSD